MKKGLLLACIMASTVLMAEEELQEVSKKEASVFKLGPLNSKKDDTKGEPESNYTAGCMCIGVYSYQPFLNCYGYYYPYRPYYYNFCYCPYRPYYYSYNYGW